MIKAFVGFAILALLTVTVFFGQPAGISPVFDVTTVKPSAPDSTGATLRIDVSGRLTTSGITLKNLIQLAYHVQENEVIGGPSWMGSIRFDILAKATTDSPNDVTKLSKKQTHDLQDLRLQALLADRFQLKIHREKKERSGYELIVARGGPKVQKVSSSAANPPGQTMSMTLFCKFLSLQVGLPVIDETKLAGDYSIKLKWTSEDGQSRGVGVGYTQSNLPPDDANGPSIFTALQEQLGLKLQSKKVLGEVVVIDTVARPREN